MITFFTKATRYFKYTFSQEKIGILYGEVDEVLYKESADYIYQNVSSESKSVKCYSNSRHLMTLGEDQEEIQADILSFLNNLQC